MAKRLGLVSEVCCYLSMETEPGTDALIARLVRDGVRVHVPRVSGTAMQWCEYAPGDGLRESDLGIREPTGEGGASSRLLLQMRSAIDSAKAAASMTALWGASRRRSRADHCASHWSSMTKCCRYSPWNRTTFAWTSS